MPVNFYHFRTPAGALIEDDVGDEFETAEEAVQAGVLAAAELVTSMRLAGGAFEIHAEGGSLVERLPVTRHCRCRCTTREIWFD